MTQVLGEGTRVARTSVSTFYRDAAGRMRTESSERVLIYDPVAKVVYTLDPKTKTYTRRDDRSDQVTIAVVDGATHVRSRSGDIPSTPTHVDLGIPVHASQGVRTTTEELPPQLVNGVAAKGTRITSTVPPGAFGNDREVKIVTERWYSDELQVLIKSTNSDPRFGVTTYELTNIVPGSPAPGLFQIPGDYREREAHR